MLIFALCIIAVVLISVILVVVLHLNNNHSKNNDSDDRPTLSERVEEDDDHNKDANTDEKDRNDMAEPEVDETPGNIQPNLPTQTPVEFPVETPVEPPAETPVEIPSDAPSDLPPNLWDEELEEITDPVETLPAEAFYIIPDSDSRYLTEADLAHLTDAELRLARNEIYARHGRMFSSADLQEYFDQQPWYCGTIAPNDFDQSILNAYESKNAAFILEYENGR